MRITVKEASAMMVGTERTITGGVNNLGAAIGTFVIEKTGEDQWRITKFPDEVSRFTARTLLMLQRHGPLLIAGDKVLVFSGRQVVPRIKPRTILAADGVEIETLTGRVTMTERGRGFFRSQERLVFSVPFGKTGVVNEVIADALHRHHK